MKKCYLLLIAILVTSLFILAPYSKVISYQVGGSPDQNKIRKRIQQDDVFQTITEYNVTTSYATITTRSPTFGEPINTSVNEIIPYHQTESPLIITATGPSDLSNVTLYYKYSRDNKTRLYATAINEVAVSTESFNYPNAITSVDGIGFISSYLTNSLVVCDLTNSSNITYLSILNDGIRTTRIESTEATRDGNYCYTLTRNGFGTSVISVYNATNPTALSLMNSKFLPAACKGMYLEMDEEEEFLYATGDYYICIYNINDKAAGQLDYVGAINLTEILPKGIIWKIHIVGNTLYAPCGYHSNTSMGWKGLLIYNITNRIFPTHANTLNWTTTYGWDCQIFTHSNGFQYLVYAGISQLAPYRRAKVNLYNISAGNATHPKFMYTMNICDPGGNCSNSFGVVYNDYLFLRNENINHTSNPNWNTGFWVFNLTDINNPTNLTRLYGDGAPNCLEAIHYIEGDKNGSSRSIYMLSMNDDALAVIDPTWKAVGTFDSPSYQFGNPDTYPYSWNFNFPNGTGYYQFYSIGQKIGLLPEEPPSHSDAMLHYTNQTIKVDFSYNPENPTTDDIIHFSDTSIIYEGWIVNWTWDFGDGNHDYSPSATHQFGQYGDHTVNLTVTNNENISYMTSKTIPVKKPTQFTKSLILGRITNLNIYEKSITFNAMKTVVFYLKPFTLASYISGEELTISKEYRGFVGRRYILAACDIAIEDNILTRILLH